MAELLAFSGVGKQYPEGSAVGVKVLLGRTPNTRRWALQPLDLSVPEGVSLALLGRNGSGKSTLLGLAAGTVTPTAGVVRRAVDPTLLFQVGTSFDEELSGAENVRLDLLLRGLDGRGLEHAFDAAREIAGIEGAWDEPLRTYSAGMRARIAMGAALAEAGRLLLIDEILAVSDAAFVEECVARLWERTRAGSSLVFVTHDTHLAAMLGQESIVLDAGVVVARGSIDEGLKAYEGLYHHR
jgi:ABC-type polysaccharide/polyol phosphate transport system ATPase subunit